jgi:hypothetical protein
MSVCAFIYLFILIDLALPTCRYKHDLSPENVLTIVFLSILKIK